MVVITTLEEVDHPYKGVFKGLAVVFWKLVKGPISGRCLAGR